MQISVLSYLCFRVWMSLSLASWWHVWPGPALASAGTGGVGGVETGVFVGITPWCPVVPRPADICSATGQCAALLPIQTAGAGQGGGPLARLLLLQWFCWLNWISILPSQHEMYDVWYKICEDCYISYIKALTFKTKTQLLSISM